MNPYRIILADDHALVRQGVKKILEQVEEIEIAGEAGDGLELLALLSETTPDLVLLDISMPKLRGIEAIHEIKTKYPDVKILVLTMHANIEYLRRALSAGAHGYLLKTDVDTELFSAIEKIRQGNIYISHHLSVGMVDEWIRLLRGEKVASADLLTDREKEILTLIAEGKSSKETAGLLGISYRTVDRHRANIMDKLNLKNVADLVKYAMQKGLL